MTSNIWADCEKFVFDATALSLNELQKGETWLQNDCAHGYAFREGKNVIWILHTLLLLMFWLF